MSRRSSRQANTGEAEAPSGDVSMSDAANPVDAAEAAAEAEARAAGEQQYVWDDGDGDAAVSDDGDVVIPPRGGGSGGGGVGLSELMAWGEEEGSEGEGEEDHEFEGEEDETDEYEESESGSEEEEAEDEGEEGPTVLRANLSGAGIMNLLFGRQRSLLGSQQRQQLFREMPRLPLPLRPLQGELAATLNNATRGYDVGQAGPIWGCLDTSCDTLRLPTITTEHHMQLHQQRSGFKRVMPPPEPCNSVDGCGEGQQGGHKSGSKAAKRQQQKQQSLSSSAAAADGGGGGVGSAIGSAISSLVQHAAAAAGGAAAAESGGSGGVTTRSSARRSRTAGTAIAAEPAGEAAAAAATAGDDQRVPPSSRRAGPNNSNTNTSSPSSTSSSSYHAINTACMLLKREVALGRQYGFSRSQQTHMHCARTFPVFPQKVRDHMSSRCYIGQYSASGDFFIAAFQDRRVRLYDTTRNWALRKDVTTRMTRWTITDTTMSPDQRLLVYSSISPVAFVVNVGSSYDVVESQANITEVHEPLAFDGRYADGADARRGGRRGAAGGSDDDDDVDWDGGMGIWSIAWSPQGGQLIAGTNGNAVYVYDIVSKRCLTKLGSHHDDVNAVAYLREGDPHLIVSGSDDSFVRVWDIRDRSGTLRAPQGVLVGHTEGITHISPKGDGHHLISNCKDQTIKLWDTRRAVGHSQAAAAARDRPRIPRWDYRWEENPANGYAVQHPHDSALMTYRGHAVLQTLIRAYFSPEHTTGQRYIYAGNAEGDILVWDVVSGKQVAKLQHNQSLVRDCSWHPYEPELTSVSWDGRIITWGVQPPDKPISSSRYHGGY